MEDPCATTWKILPSIMQVLLHISYIHVLFYYLEPSIFHTYSVAYKSKDPVIHKRDFSSVYCCHICIYVVTYYNKSSNVMICKQPSREMIVHLDFISRFV